MGQNEIDGLRSSLSILTRRCQNTKEPFLEKISNSLIPLWPNPNRYRDKDPIRQPNQFPAEAASDFRLPMSSFKFPRIGAYSGFFA